MKKIISLIIATVMLLSVFGTSSFADIDVPAMSFDDLVDGAWYMEGISYCYYQGIVNGMTANSFVPNGTLTRAQFVQMLAGLDGADLSQYAEAESGFEDVAVGAWYNAAVCWAKENGYAAGVSETRFAPNDPVTREQLARFFYTYGLSYVELGFDMSASDDLSAFEDAESVSDWALEGVQWCVAAGIISGMTETTIAPRETATRAQACRMIMCFDEYIASGGPKDTEGAFKELADYIVSKDPDSTNQYSVYELDTEDNINYYVRYDEVEKEICFMYSHDVWYSPLGDGTEAKNYEYSTYLEINGLEESYDVDFSYCEFITYRYGFANYVLTYDGYTLTEHYLEEYTGDIPDEELTEEKMLNTANEDVEKLMVFVNDVLTEAGLEINDIFVLPEIME